MRYLNTWYSPAGRCWRIEDGEMFTYYTLDLVIAHFRNRPHPAGALLAAPPHNLHTGLLDTALRAASIKVEYATE